MSPRRGQSELGTWLLRVVVVVVAFALARWVRETYWIRDVMPSGEGQLVIRYWEVARTSFLRGDGFPLWDRSQCGGWPFLGNPDTPLVSSLIAGVFRIHGDVMSRWMITLWMVVAHVGTYAWCRRSHGLGRVASFWAGAIFACSGFVIFQFPSRVHFAPLALLPWVLWLVREGEKDLRYAIGCGAALALMTLEGGVLQPLAFTIVALLCTLLPRLFHGDAGPKRVFAALGVATLTFALLAGVKLYPALVELSRYPRVFKEGDKLDFHQIATFLLENETFKGLGTAYGRDEYRAYLGPLACGMAIAGAGTAIILPPRRFDIPLIIVAGLLFARGMFIPQSPYALSLKLPIFEQLNVPGRWLALVMLGVAVAGAVALDAAIKAVRRPFLIAVVVLASMLAIFDVASAGKKVLAQFPPEPFLKRPDPAPAAYQIVPEDPHRSEYPMRNVGVTGCYALGLGFKEANGFTVGPRPQATVDGGGKVEAAVRQDRYDLDVDLSRPAIVRINQTFDPDWRSSSGEVRRGATGLLEVSLPAGKQQVAVRYRPAGLVPGLVATSLGTMAAIAACLWLTRRARTLTTRR